MPSGIKKTKTQLIDELSVGRQGFEKGDVPKQLALIQAIDAGLSQQLSLQEVYDLVGEKLQEYFEDSTIVISEYDQKTDQINFTYRQEMARMIDGYSLALDEILSGHVIKTGKPILHSRSAEIIKLSKKLRAGEIRVDAKSFIGVPFLSNRRAIGMISVQNFNTEGAFNQSNLQLLETMAGSMSIALEKARLLEEVKQRDAELVVINAVQQALAAQLNINEIYEIIGDKVCEIFKAQAVVIYVADLNAQLMYYPYTHEKGKRLHSDPQPINNLHRHIMGFEGTFVASTGFAELVSQFPDYEIPIGELPKSLVVVPVSKQGNLSVSISLQDMDREHVFRDTDVRLLETLAASMSVALENARLFDETSQRNAELAIINSVGEAMSQNLDVDTVIKIVGDKVQQIFDADMVAIGLTNDQESYVEIPYSYALGEYFEEEPIPIGKGLASKLFETRQPVLLNTAEELEAAGSVKTQADKGSEKLIQSWLGVPIIVGDSLIGGVAVQSFNPYAFKDSDLSLLSTMALNMGVAIENARLFDETNRLLKESQQHANELSTINAVSVAMASELELEALIEIIGERVQKIFNADIVTLALVNDRTNMIEFPYAFGDSLEKPIKLGEGLTSKILESGEPFLINRADAWQQIEEKIKRVGVRSKSFLGVPILVGKNAIGALSVQCRKSFGRFDDRDMGLLNTIAANVGVALVNARLFDELQNSYHKISKVLERQSATSDILHIIANSPGEIQPVINALAKHAAKLCEADDVQLYRVEQDRLLQVGHFGPLPSLKDTDSLPLVEGLVTGKAILKRKTIQLDAGELSEDEYPVSVELQRRLKHRSVVVTPLVREGEAIGAIVARRNEVRPFSDSQISLLNIFSDQAAIAIENVRLFNEVERQKEYLEALISSSPVAIVTIDLDGVVTGWSPASESLFGFSEKEALGKQIDDLVANNPEIRDEAETYTRKYLTQVGRVHIRGRRTHKDGHLIDVDIHALPVTIEGEQIGYIAIYNDITELEQARRAAEEANQAKSAFLANMSHELRTPLNAILGFTRIVKRKGLGILPEKQVDNLEKVLISAEHLLDLINTVLDISKIEAGKMDVQPANFNLSPLVEMVVTTTQPLVRQDSVRLETMLSDDLPPIFSDQDKVKQILINLLSNAAKFTHEGQIMVSVEKLNGQFHIKVMDTGVGIPPDALEHIFEEFQQADNSTTREYGGTGLGLSISRSLARLVEGDLTVSSTVGKGSTFTLTLPLRFGEMGTPSTTEMMKDKPITSEDVRVVLVIDDNLDAINLMRQNLEETGYQVITATSGDEGIAKAKRYQPFAITLDIMMPKKDGWQVMHELKSDPETREIPVVMVTIVDKKTLGFRLGAADYLIKPLDEEQVLTSLERLAQSTDGSESIYLLVIDDDPDIIDMVNQLLEDSNYTINSAANGEDALEKIINDPPDVIILDLMLPKLDGFGVIDHLHSDECLRQIPLIVLTAKLLSQEEQDRLLTSAVKIMQKQGLTNEELLSEISLAVTSR
jgi:PAS domain S-box-containing protein